MINLPSKATLTVVTILGLILVCLAPLAAQDLGDVNNDTVINIVDALMIARYVVGLNVPGFHAEVANVDCSGSIEIIDALIVARYTVGLISSFPCDLEIVTVSHMRGIQCDIVYLDTIEDARAELEMFGIEVLAIVTKSVPVVALCGVWDGINYVASIYRRDLDRALAIGWRPGG